MGNMKRHKFPILSGLQDEHFQDLALRMALHCVRNTVIEDYHVAGKLTNPEMAALNREVTNKIYSFLLILFSTDYAALRDVTLAWLYPPNHWDKPKFDESFLVFVNALRRHPAMPPWIMPPPTDQPDPNQNDPLAP